MHIVNLFLTMECYTLCEKLYISCLKLSSHVANNIITSFHVFVTITMDFTLEKASFFGEITVWVW